MQQAGMEQLVTERPVEADRQRGSLLERVLFNHRRVVIALCAAASLLLAAQLPNLRLNASFERMIPTDHPYIQNFLAHKNDLAGQGNAVRIIVENTHGTIMDRAYLDMLQKINDEVYLIPGVDRPFMKSLWTPTMRWLAVTQDGLDGGPVIDSDYDGSLAAVEKVRAHIDQSGEIGGIVAPDFRSSMLLVPLLDHDAMTGRDLDYRGFAHRLDEIRAKYDSGDIRLHVVGFAQVVGDLIDGLHQMLFFFGIAIVICAAMVLWYTRCIRSTGLVVACSLVAVVWQLGLLPLLGLELDPYSILVPFLVFAIGMSHGSQKMNGVMQDIGRGAHRLAAARSTFRRLFFAGFSALICDAVGFAVLLLIRISVIQELALVASLGVAILIFTNLILLPILLSYTGVSSTAAARAVRAEPGPAGRHVAWRALDIFTRRRWAAVALAVAFILGGVGLYLGQELKIGDLDAGAPELRANSRYNLDNAFLNAHYNSGSDMMVIMVTSPDQACGEYATLHKIDALDASLRQIKGVAATDSFASFTRQMTREMTEDNPKWFDLVPNQAIINNLTKFAPRETINHGCDLSMLHVFLTDHRAETLTRVVDAAKLFAFQNNTADVNFLLLAGGAGIEAATNIVVNDANTAMLYWVYGAIILLCLLAFRSVPAVICAVAPLVLTTILAQALMVVLGIGVKVATLPVIALGVGIGIDYALYVMSILIAHLRQGCSLSEAYYRALLFTGKVVLLTGCTLAAAVGIWAFSPIKFQADMGVLLAFCFLWNMLGALVLLPALAAFLLPRNTTSVLALPPAAPVSR